MKFKMKLMLLILPTVFFAEEFDANKFINGCMKVGQKRIELKKIWKENLDKYNSIDKNNGYFEKFQEATKNNDYDKVLFYTNLLTEELQIKRELQSSTLEYLAVGTLYLDPCGIIYSFEDVKKTEIERELNGIKNMKKMTETIYDNKGMSEKNYNELLSIQNKVIETFTDYYNKK